MEFTTKPRQAQAMIGRAQAADVPFAWFTADEIYGQARCLRAWLEDQSVSHVMAIRRCDTFITAAGEQPADALIAALPARFWQRLSAGRGTRPARVPLGADPHAGRDQAWPHALAAGPSAEDPRRACG